MEFCSFGGFDGHVTLACHRVRRIAEGLIEARRDQIDRWTKWAARIKAQAAKKTRFPMTLSPDEADVSGLHIGRAI